MNTSIYIHVPFCTKKCPYCHFYVIPDRAAYQQLLSDAIALEWQSQAPLLEGNSIVSIYFGGGTPSLFHGIGPILEKIPKAPDCEITIEANPENSSIERFSYFRALGINRLSLGVQSLDDRSLQTLERAHSAQKAKLAIWDAFHAGFQNISIDLMYDLPGQTEESWQYTLDQLSDLPIRHLSLYNLTIEPHTPFYKRQVKTPDQELSLALHLKALNKLDALGFERYEISAFAKEGLVSRHNLGYWTGRPFLGLGPSAFSYWNGERFRNVANLHRYARAIKAGVSAVDFREKLAPEDHFKELFAIRLRVKEGADASSYPEPIILSKLIEQGFLMQNGTCIQLTEQGMLHYDTVASALI